MARRNSGPRQRPRTTPDHRNLLSLATQEVPVTKHPGGNPVLAGDDFAAILAKLRKGHPVTVTLIDGVSISGRVDLVSLNGDVLWIHTRLGRRMLYHSDVALLRKDKS